MNSEPPPGSFSTAQYSRPNNHSDLADYQTDVDEKFQTDTFVDDSFSFDVTSFNNGNRGPSKTHSVSD